MRVIVLVSVVSLVAPGASHASEAVHLQANLLRFCDADEIVCPIGGSPHVTTVTPGTTVDWVFNDLVCDVGTCGHNVTFEDGEGGPTLNRGLGGTGRPLLFTRTFDTPGTYQYWCSPHKATGMLGTVTVSGP